MTFKNICKKIANFILWPYSIWLNKKKQTLSAKILEIHKNILDEDYYNCDNIIVALDIITGGNDEDDYALYLSGVDPCGLNRIEARKKFKEANTEKTRKLFYISAPNERSRHLCRNIEDAYKVFFKRRK